MEYFLLILNVAVAIILGIVLWKLFSKKPENPQSEQSLLLLQNQISENNKHLQTEFNQVRQELQNQLQFLTQNVSQNLQNNQQSLQKQSISNTQIYKDITEKLAKLESSSNQIVDFSKQLQDLQNILKSPKQRGILGEYYLNLTLENVLPPGSYATQHNLGKNDEGQDLIVDAAIFIKNQIIPVDAKFSLENYQKLIDLPANHESRPALESKFKQDLKNRINETAKYIRPDLGTMDFAFMFIPAEAIYYDLLINTVGVSGNTGDLIEYAARDKKVIIVSPTTFLAYLQTVLQGLRAMQIEESAKEIGKHVQKLQKHALEFNDNLDKLGKHFNTAISIYNQSRQDYRKLNNDLIKLGGENTEEIEPFLLEKTNTD
ncbi:MAG TPA: DNA recombination protein RmuC [bacterium]|nr:DNA recombination protein RmuC [bacterium]